jgi:hypothetical protein
MLGPTALRLSQLASRSLGTSPSVGPKGRAASAPLIRPSPLFTGGGAAAMSKSMTTMTAAAGVSLPLPLPAALEQMQEVCINYRNTRELAELHYSSALRSMAMPKSYDLPSACEHRAARAHFEACVGTDLSKVRGGQVSATLFGPHLVANMRALASELYSLRSFYQDEVLGGLRASLATHHDAILILVHGRQALWMDASSAAELDARIAEQQYIFDCVRWELLAFENEVEDIHGQQRRLECEIESIKLRATVETVWGCPVSTRGARAAP